MPRRIYAGIKANRGPIIFNGLWTKKVCRSGAQPLVKSVAKPAFESLEHPALESTKIKIVSAAPDSWRQIALHQRSQAVIPAR
jgi:hypothetical protein